MTSEAEARVRNPADGTHPDIPRSPSPASTPATSGAPALRSVPPDPNPDAPVRIEVEMPRDLYGRIASGADHVHQRLAGEPALEVVGEEADELAGPGADVVGGVRGQQDVFEVP